MAEKCYYYVFSVHVKSSCLRSDAVVQFIFHLLQTTSLLFLPRRITNFGRINVSQPFLRSLHKHRCNGLFPCFILLFAPLPSCPLLSSLLPLLLCFPFFNFLPFPLLISLFPFSSPLLLSSYLLPCPSSPLLSSHLLLPPISPAACVCVLVDDVHHWALRGNGCSRLPCCLV